MRVLMINTVCGIGSTGRICTDLAAALEKQGHEVKIAYGRERVPESARRWAVRIGTDTDVRLHGAYARLNDAAGLGSRRATERFLDWVRDYDPDIIHLHNLHGYYLHIGILFDYLKSCGKPVFWTLHDSWPFTGHGAQCEAPQCGKWRTGCDSCAQIAQYPRSLTDHAARNWRFKRACFTGVERLMLITPSQWLAGRVRDSFLRDYPAAVIPNGIDTAVFRPFPENPERFAERPFTVLGVASVWSETKGLDDLLRLRELMPREWSMVLVGLSERQLAALPEGVRGIARTHSPQQLRELYAAADVFVNPTTEDTYPTTNLEAIACGTPVVTYPTGGSPESARLFGAVTDDCTPEALLRAIQQLGTPERHAFDFSKETFAGRVLELYARASEPEHREAVL